MFPGIALSQVMDWTPDASVVLGLGVVAGLYGLLVGPLRERVAPGQPFPKANAVFFYLGLLVLYLAVGTPIDTIGERYLFSVHMFQHNLLMYPVPTLMLLGTPRWLVDPLFRSVGMLPLGRFLTHPVVALIIPNLVFTGWHFPPLYELALRSRFVHLIEHMTMLGSCLLLWWPVHSPSALLGRYSYGGQMLYLFLHSIAQIPVFFFITFTGETYYPTYEMAARIVNLTPLQDQQLGGAVMKIVGMLVMGAAILRAFLKWYQEEERRPVPPARRAPAPRPV